LGVIRLSELTDESTSPTRQREIIAARAQGRGSTIVGWAEDLDVSASKIHPMKRPQLSKWLERPGEYDELIFWRLDRFVRKTFPDFMDMVTWSLDHGISLVSATEPLDLSGPIGRMVAVALATVAELESSNTSERVTGAHAYLRREGRWGLGRAPLGYMIVPNPDGKGYVLIIDDEAAELCREAVRRVIAGASVNSVTADFNRRRILSPRDRTRLRSGRPTLDIPWSRNTLAKMLRSENLLGYVTYNKVPVTDEHGIPLRRAAPIISETEWDQLQHVMADPARARQRRRTHTPSLLLHVAYCALCGARCYRQMSTRNEKTLIYYRCRTHYQRAEQRATCSSLPIPAPKLDGIAEKLFLAMVGSVEIQTRVYRPGVDHSDEIALIRRSLASVRREFDGGAYSYPGGEEEYNTRVARLSERLRTLADQPVTDAQYEYRPTGQTFADRWAVSDVMGKRQLMIGAGFQIRVARTSGNVAFGWQLDPDLGRRAGLAAEGRPVNMPDTTEAWRNVLAPLQKVLRPHGGDRQ
jgi:site-specific DNA recombinase